MKARFKHHRVAEMAARTDGVTAADARREFGLNANAACSLMSKAEGKHGLVRIHHAGSRNRWFATNLQAQVWLAKQLQVIDRVITAKQAATSRRSRQPQEAGCAAVATARAPNAQTVSKPKSPAAAAQAAWAAQPAVMTERTKVTVYERSPSRDRVDLMADPLPGVPGWKSGPYIRPGSLAPRPQLLVEGGSK